MLSYFIASSKVLSAISKTRFFQNSDTAGEKPFNSKKYTHMIITKLRNCAKLELQKSGIGQFCAKCLLRMIAQIAVFSRKTDAQRKKNFAFRSAKILRMETLSAVLSEQMLKFP